MDLYDPEESCLFCSAPGSCCNCGLSDSPWSPSIPLAPVQAPLFYEHEKPADLEEITRFVLHGNHFLGAPFEHNELELEDTQVWLGPGTTLVATDTKNNDDDDDYNYNTTWKFPDISLSPPQSSSPIGLMSSDFSPPSTDPVDPVSSDAESMSRHEDVTVGPHFNLLYEPRVCCEANLGTGHTGFAIKNVTRLPTRTTNRPPTPHPCSELLAEEIWATDMGIPSLQNQRQQPTEISKTRSDSFTGSTDENRDCAIDDDAGVAVECADGCTQDVCAGTVVLQEDDRKLSAKSEDIARHSSLTPVSRRHHSSTSSNVSSSPKSTDPTSPRLACSPNHLGLQGSQSATSNVSNGRDNSPSKTPTSKVSNNSSSTLTQATLDNYMKRRRPTIDCSPPSKKLKLDRRIPPRKSYVNNSSFKSNYKAKEPASLRRARSLRSEASACSDTSKDSLFSASSQRTPIPQAQIEKKDSINSFPPTAPSTPLPDSAAYARSKADPLRRTIAVHRHSSQADVDIPPVPIIAPPPYPIPTMIRCAEDQAVDRLKLLLIRERAERERDGLSVHDAKRARALKSDSESSSDTSLTRRDSTSTTDSSGCSSQWGEESTRSATDSSASQESTPSVKTPPAQHRHISRKTWSDSFGIPDSFRKDMIKWILKALPDPPRPGYSIDLYDQLKTSPHTRFHAAHMFYRYFLRPEKAQYWKEENELCKSPYSRCDLEEDGWNLAMGCVALSQKLHRDVLPPLEPVYTCELLGIAPLSWMHPHTIERSQRDIFQTLDFTLGSCTPQDVLDELWNALPTLRKAVNRIRRGWDVVQRDTWDKLLGALVEPDMMQYPVTLLTAAALIDSLIVSLALQFKTDSEGPTASVCKKCKSASAPEPRVPERAPSDIEPTSWQIYTFEAMQSVEGVILDVRDVLQLSEMELDECRRWFGYVGQD